MITRQERCSRCQGLYVLAVGGHPGFCPPCLGALTLEAGVAEQRLLDVRDGSSSLYGADLSATERALHEQGMRNRARLRDRQ